VGAWRKATGIKRAEPSERQGERGLEKTLGAHEVGLEARTERSRRQATPGVEAGAVQEESSEHGADRAREATPRHARRRRQKIAHDGENGGGEEANGVQSWNCEVEVVRRPVTVWLRGRAMCSARGLGAPRGAVDRSGETLLPELLEMSEDTGRVFLARRRHGGATRASRPLSFDKHSTVRRGELHAWARAEGKLMYHCSLAWRLMSWTLVGNPMRRTSFGYLVILLDTKIPVLLQTKKCTNVFSS